MKILLQLMIILAVFAFTTPTEATTNNYQSWTEGAQQLSKIFVRKLRRKRIAYIRYKRSVTEARSVPEMDVTIAPLAGFLLTGLVAAGFERRRKLKVKHVY